MNSYLSVLCMLSNADPLLREEALELALVAAAFEADVSVLIRRNALTGLLADDSVAGVGERLAEVSQQLSDYGIAKIYACSETLGREVRELPKTVTVVSLIEQQDLLLGHSVVVND